MIIWVALPLSVEVLSDQINRTTPHREIIHGSFYLPNWKSGSETKSNKKYKNIENNTWDLIYDHGKLYTWSWQLLRKTQKPKSVN
jgi:hypothetical protein